MPLRSHTIRVFKVINSPLPFVYRWCTDFRADDNKITGSRTQRKILQKTKKRTIYVSIYGSSRKPKLGINIVSLKPPKAWHLDFVGEDDDETGDYKLTRLSPTQTRLDMVFREKYKIRDHPSQAEDTKHTSDIWDKYVEALERDYRNKK
jgi:hypothetical protein